MIAYFVLGMRDTGLKSLKWSAKVQGHSQGRWRSSMDRKSH